MYVITAGKSRRSEISRLWDLQNPRIIDFRHSNPPRLFVILSSFIFSAIMLSLYILLLVTPSAAYYDRAQAREEDDSSPVSLAPGGLRASAPAIRRVSPMRADR